MSYDDKNKIDKLHERCDKCEIGIYELSGKSSDHLHCDMCNESVFRWHDENIVYEDFKRFLSGIEKKESINKNKKFLNEDAPAKRYIKRYTELPQNRIVLKGK